MNIKLAVVYNTEPKICRYIQAHSEFYVPIIAGRVWNKKSYDIPGLLYDDVGENISWLNPYINESTAIYWLGHHLDALGYPEYVGVQHYRRLFRLEDVIPYLDPDTLVLNKETIMLPTVDFLELCHDSGKYLSVVAKEFLSPERPEDHELFNTFAFSRTYYSRNLFVVPSEVLVGLAQYIKRLLRCVAKDINFDALDLPAARNIGFIVERMVGFYFMKMEKIHGYKVQPAVFRYVNPKELQ